MTAKNRNGIGKITIWAHDIRREVRYSVYLIFNDKGKYAGIQIGSLNADEKGKAEFRKDIETAALLGFALREITAVAVVAADTPIIIAPLCGYREHRVSWRENFYKAKEETKQKPAKKTVAEVIPEPLPEPVPEVIPEPIPARKPDPVHKPVPARKPQKSDSPAVQGAPRARKPKASVSSEISSAIETIFSTREHVSPFASEPQGEANWVKLGTFDAVPLPDNCPLLLEEPFIRTAYEEFGHLLLGISADKSKYFIGVPCEFSSELRSQAKQLGFTKFRAAEHGDTPKRGDMGYWLMGTDM
jgi:hypothetical protein